MLCSSLIMGFAIPPSSPCARFVCPSLVIGGNPKSVRLFSFRIILGFRLPFRKFRNKFQTWSHGSSASQVRGLWHWCPRCFAPFEPSRDLVHDQVLVCWWVLLEGHHSRKSRPQQTFIFQGKRVLAIVVLVSHVPWLHSVSPNALIPGRLSRYSKVRSSCSLTACFPGGLQT